MNVCTSAGHVRGPVYGHDYGPEIEQKSTGMSVITGMQITGNACTQHHFSHDSESLNEFWQDVRRSIVDGLLFRHLAGSSHSLRTLG